MINLALHLAFALSPYLALKSVTRGGHRRLRPEAFIGNSWAFATT